MSTDPMDAAVQDAESAANYFGKLDVSAQFIVLKKGEKKATWFEGMDLEGRTTEVSIRLNPLDCTGLTKFIERQIISNSGEWSRIVWPSLRDLGIKALKDINGQWAHVAMVPSGRSWQNKEGQTVQGSTFRFIALFTLESDCIRAWETQFGGTQAHSANTNGAAPAVSQIDESDKKAAMQFLPHIVQTHKGDPVALAAALASISLLNKYFTINSPEVQALLQVA